MGLNAKFWAILGRVVDNSEWPNSKALSKALLAEWGHVDRWMTMGGEVHQEAGSLADLEDSEFGRFYEWAMAYICEHVIPGMDREELERQPERTR
jgi:hypothetical protein